MTGTVRREHHALVDYAQAQQAFLSPVAPERPAAGVPGTPGRRLRDAAEPIATISWWGRPVNDRLAALGLDFLTGYPDADVTGAVDLAGRPARLAVARRDAAARVPR